MKLHDELYGTYKVEPVLEELIHSPAVQRLKGIHMAGPAYLLNPLWNETRYEHSVGVMLLVRKLGGSLEEQIAALLHDISHTAFSHTIDVALGMKAESYHEQIKHTLVAHSDLPQILQKHGYDPAILEDDSRFYLLEKPLPALCCDRLDYTLREVHRYYGIPLQEIWDFLDALTVQAGEICISEIRFAEWFVNMYQLVVCNFFYEPLNVIANDVMAKIMGYSLKENLIDEADLLLEDDPFLAKIKGLNHPKLNAYLEYLKFGVAFERVSPKDDFTTHLKLKPRIIDPTVFDGVKRQASEVSEVVARLKAQAETLAQTGIYLKVGLTGQELPLAVLTSQTVV